MNSNSRKGLKKNIKEDHINSVKIFLLLVLIFTLFAHTVGDNENSRLNTTIALVEDNTLVIDRLHNNTGDKAYIDGQYYSDKAPLASFFALPSYTLVDNYFEGSLENSYYLESFRRSHDPKMEWGRFFTTVSVSSFAGAFTCVLLFLILRYKGVNRLDSLGISILSGTATLIFPYSTTFHGTMLGTLFLVSATLIWITADYSPSEKESLIISLLLGLGVSAEYLIIIPGGILLTLIILENLKSFRNYIYLLLGTIIGLSPLLAFNYLSTGNMFYLTLFYVLENTESISTSIVPSIKILTPTILVLSIRNLLSPLNGLFLYSPFLLFGLIGLRKLKNDKKLLIFILGSFVTSVLFVSAIPLSNLRTFYGPRYLLPVSTLLLIPLALEIKNGSSKFKRLLIYCAGLASSIVMLGSTQTWLSQRALEEPITMDVYVQEMLSIGIYENRLRSYVTNLVSEGLQSPILSYLTGTSSEFYMVLTPYPEYKFIVGEFLNLVILYDIRFLSLLIISLSAILLFKNEITTVDYITPKALTSMLLLLLVAGFSSSTSYHHDWYNDDFQEAETWGRDNPEIYFTSEQDKKAILELKARTYDEKEFEIILNDEKLKNVNISPETSHMMEKIEIKEGLNKLEFKAESCDIIGRFTNNNDVRCVTIGLTDYDIRTLKTESLEFHNTEPDVGEPNSLSDNPKVFVGGPGKYSLELKAFSETETEFQIIQDGKVISEPKVDVFGSTVNTPYREMDEISEFRFNKGCDNCRINIRDVTVKDYNRQHEDSIYRLGTNWYNQVETEEVRWSKENPTLFVYNYLENPVDKELLIVGRMFEEDRVEFILNNELIGTKKIPDSIYKNLNNNGRKKNKFKFNITLEPGQNKLELKENNSCTHIGESIGNDDIRCVTFGFKSLYLSER